jgi:integrase
MTGARIATMAGLLWSDINNQTREITFRLKGEEQMTFPISREMSAFLSTIPRSNVIKARRFVFTRIDKNTVERVKIVPKGGVFNTEFRKAVSDAEVVDFRFHDLRHTFATRMLRQSRDLKLVSRLLGHKSIETTSRYAHVLVDDMRNALEEFSPINGGIPQSFLRSIKLSD